MKIGIYIRVSTGRQESRNQLTQLRHFASKQGWRIFREYPDVDSGGKADRQAFKRMFAEASQRKFDLVLFWSLDRFSREGVLPTLQYLERLTSYGIQWRSFTEPFFDSCGPFRDAVIGIMAVLAKQERIKISERTIAGLERARAEGKVLGRPRCEVDVAEIRRLRRSGLSWMAVGQELGVSAATALLRLRAANLKKASRDRSRRTSGNRGILRKRATMTAL